MAAPEQYPPPQRRTRDRLRDRNTGDLLVLLIAGTVSFVVVLTTLSLVVGELIHPEADDSAAAGQIGDIINTLVGLLAGFLAGRSGQAIARITEGSKKDLMP